MAPTKGGSPNRAASRNGNGRKQLTPGERRRRVEQAAGEVVDTDGSKVAKVVDYRGIEFTLPDKLPAPVLLDVVEFEANTENMMPMLRLLRSILGPEQFVLLRNSLANDDDFNDWSDLFNAVMGHYGVTMGESSASQDS